MAFLMENGTGETGKRKATGPFARWVLPDVPEPRIAMPKSIVAS